MKKRVGSVGPSADRITGGGVREISAEGEQDFPTDTATKDSAGWRSGVESRKLFPAYGQLSGTGFSM